MVGLGRYTFANFCLMALSSELGLPLAANEFSNSFFSSTVSDRNSKLSAPLSSNTSTSRRSHSMRRRWAALSAITPHVVCGVEQHGYAVSFAVLTAPLTNFIH